MYKVKVDVEKMIGLKIKQGLILVLSATCIFTPTVYSEMEPYATAKEQFSPAALDNSGNSVNDSHVLQLNTLQDLSANAKAKIVGNGSVTDIIDKKSPLPATPNQNINNSVDYMVADLNQDGKVNDDDLEIMKSRFFASTGDVRYDSKADFNTDGVINFTDLGIFKYYYTVAKADLNQDGKVDDADLGVMKSRFFASTGDVRYDSKADFNTDGVINFIDLGIFKRYYTMPMPRHSEELDSRLRISGMTTKKINAGAWAMAESGMILSNKTTPIMIPNPNKPSTTPLYKVNKIGQSQIKTAMPNNLVPAIVPSPRLPKHNKGIVVIQNINHSKGNIIRPSSGINLNNEGRLID